MINPLKAATLKIYLHLVTVKKSAAAVSVLIQLDLRCCCDSIFNLFICKLNAYFYIKKYSIKCQALKVYREIRHYQ